VEDLTGWIPLLLDKSVINGNIDLANELEDLRKIHNQVQQFMRNLKEDPTLTESKVRLRSFNWFREIADLRSHCNYVIACINGGPVETIDRSLVDHRYFYEEGGFGKYACGVARIDSCAITVFQDSEMPAAYLL
jgi:hypothetical protein